MTVSGDERRIASIVIYPIKSAAGITLDTCEVEARGLAMDRRWMVVDNRGDFLTGREFPMLTQIRPQLKDAGLQVSAPGARELFIPLHTGSAVKEFVTVWDDECLALAAGGEVDAWFTTVLGTPCRLVYMSDDSRRPIDVHHSRPGDLVSFADGYPLLLISRASLNDLNTRLSEPVSMRRFRPNLVVDGCVAYEEDGWRSIRVGEAQFEGVKTCARCVFTTIDPDNGEKHPGLEPLRTLGAYRRGLDGSVFFGRNLIPRSLGRVRVGDCVNVNGAKTTAPV